MLKSICFALPFTSISVKTFFEFDRDFVGYIASFLHNSLTAEPVSLLHPHSPYCPSYNSCMCSEEQFPQQVGTLFDFLLHSSEKCTDLQKVRSSNLKPVSEIHINLVLLTDPCVAIKTKNIYNH